MKFELCRLFFGTNCDVNRGIIVNSYNFLKLLAKDIRYEIRFTSFHFMSPFSGTNCDVNRGITVNSYNFLKFLVNNIQYEIRFTSRFFWNQL